MLSTRTLYRTTQSKCQVKAPAGRRWAAFGHARVRENHRLINKMKPTLMKKIEADAMPVAENDRHN
jgi:hypothetical protein